MRLVVIGALESLLLCGAGQSVETLVGWRLKNNVPVAEFYGKVRVKGLRRTLILTLTLTLTLTLNLTLTLTLTLPLP